MSKPTKIHTIYAFLPSNKFLTTKQIKDSLRHEVKLETAGVSAALCKLADRGLVEVRTDSHNHGNCNLWKRAKNPPRSSLKRFRASYKDRNTQASATKQVTSQLESASEHLLSLALSLQAENKDLRTKLDRALNALK